MALCQLSSTCIYNHIFSMMRDALPHGLAQYTMFSNVRASTVSRERQTNHPCDCYTIDNI